MHTLAAGLAIFHGDAQPAPAAASVAARAGEAAAGGAGAADAPEPRAAPAHDPVNAGVSADIAARGELLRVAEHALKNGADGRDTNTQTVPQLQFAHAVNEARQAPAVAPAARLHLDTPLGTAGWNTELAQKVVWMAGEKQHVAALHVNPPELGPLDIKLTIDDHQTTAVFTSPHSSVRDAVESALPRLREVLAESGIMLGNASVTADSPRDGSAFAPPPARTLASADNESAEAAAARLAPGGGGIRRGHGLVDLFA
jgi:flagellar hook-length control protein FliK